MTFLLTVLALAWASLVADRGAGGAVFAPVAAELRAPARRLGPSPATLALRDDLDRLIQVPGGRAQFSVLVVSLDRGDTVYAHDPDLPLAPASNMKLYTATSALYYAGPDYRYSTYVLTGGAVQDGVVNGDVVLYGTGDPSLSFRFHGNSTATMRDFADSLAAQGIHEIRGDVVGDASYFQGYLTGPGWLPHDMNASFAVPSSALSLNENLVSVRVSPGPGAGVPAVVEGIPGGRWLAVQNEAVTTARGRTTIDVRRWSYDGPIVVKGQIRRGAAAIIRVVPAADPAQYAAAAFREALEARGIQVDGAVRANYDAAKSAVTGRAVFAPAFGRGAPLHVLMVYQSPPLEEILDIMMHLSHNMFAEQTARTVGRLALGDGSVAGAHRAVMAMLHCETGDDSLMLHQVDGSGLSGEDRTTTRTMIRLLSFAARAPFFPDLWKTLPEAGHPHLMRMFQTAAQNNLRAKTGTIDNVSALSGYVRAADGERLAFSIISNGDRSTWKAKRVEDAIGARLAAFSRPEGELATPAGPDVRPPTVPAPGNAAPAGPARRMPAAATPPVPATPFWHTVRRGETLSGIARRYGTTVEAIEAANPGLSPRRIRPGQRLQLPKAATLPQLGAPGSPRSRPAARTPRRRPRTRHHR